jgi:7 transmembrane receptor (rhodopsin family)
MSSEVSLFEINSFNYSEPELMEVSFSEDPIVRIIFALFLLVMIIFGICGNALVIYIIFVKWRVQTAFNLFIANVAVAELIFTTNVAIPFLLQLFTGEWLLGDFLCRMGRFFDAYTMTCVINTLVLALITLNISGDLIIASIILIFAHIPGFHLGLISYSNSETMVMMYNQRKVEFCIEKWSGFMHEHFYHLQGVFYFLQPTIVLIIFGLITLVEKIANIKIMKGFVYNSMIVALIVIFMLSYFPRYLLEHIHVENIQLHTSLIYISDALLVLGFIYKPLFYSFFHNGLKKELKKILCEREDDQSDFF